MFLCYIQQPFVYLDYMENVSGIGIILLTDCGQ